jgi:carbon storage regulator CsrA
MLVLSRKQNEEILIGDNVCIKVVGVFGNKVRLGISAPPHVAIRRAELDFFGKTSDRLPEVDYPETVEVTVSTDSDCLLVHS